MDGHFGGQANLLKCREMSGDEPRLSAVKFKLKNAPKTSGCWRHVYLLSVITFGKSAREDNEMFVALDGILPTCPQAHLPLSAM